MASMKTALELPDDLIKRIKPRAVRGNRKLKDEIAQLLEAGLAQAGKSAAAGPPPKPVKLRGRGPISIDDIDSAIARGRD